MKLLYVSVHVWIGSEFGTIAVEFGKITVAHYNFAKSYTFELQQNHGVSVILSNSLPIQTYTKSVNCVS